MRGTDAVPSQDDDAPRHALGGAVVLAAVGSGLLGIRACEKEREREGEIEREREAERGGEKQVKLGRAPPPPLIG